MHHFTFIDVAFAECVKLQTLEHIVYTARTYIYAVPKKVRLFSHVDISNNNISGPYNITVYAYIFINWRKKKNNNNNKQASKLASKANSRVAK